MSERNMHRHFNWQPACGGKEPIFEGIDGKRYQYMWNGQAGWYSEHAYYCLNDDLFLDNSECAGRIWPN